jgi:N-dimethylarginine dimethylaminohydrolase
MSNYGTINEFSKLKTAILCPPTHFEIRKPINVIQAKWHELGRGPDPVKRIQQYEVFKNTLIREGVTVWEILPSKQYTYQVFTRDICVSTDNGLIVANLKFAPRKGEEKEVVRELATRGIDVSFTIKGPAILEGGDFVFIDKGNVLLGIGDRTNGEALEKLRVFEPSIKFHPVYLPKDFLHLDVVLNIVSGNLALAYVPALDDDTLSLLKSRRFRIINVSSEEQETMATNALAIGDNKVLAAGSNRRTNAEMRKQGLDVIEIDMSEILKGGGGPRCMTLPVLRE